MSDKRDEMVRECREAFEVWYSLGAAAGELSIHRFGDGYMASHVNAQWNAFRAAWNRRAEPKAAPVWTQEMLDQVKKDAEMMHSKIHPLPSAAPDG